MQKTTVSLGPVFVTAEANAVFSVLSGQRIIDICRLSSVHNSLNVYDAVYAWHGEKRNGPPLTNDASEIVHIANNHPAIIDRATFAKVQKLLEECRPKITPSRRSEAATF